MLTPAAVFMAVSADAMFAAVAAWGLAALAVAATGRDAAHVGCLVSGRRAAARVLRDAVLRPAAARPPGAGRAVVRPALAPLPIAAVARRRWWSAFALAGFSWWEAFPVLRDRY